MEQDDAASAELLLFDAGGRPFAARASDVDRIAGIDWRPDEPGDEGEAAKGGRYRLVELARVLGLPGGSATRTLIVGSGPAAFGLLIDGFGGAVLGRFALRDLPSLLGDWLDPAVVAGLAELGEDRRLVTVLDLRTLVQLVSERTIVEA